MALAGSGVWGKSRPKPGSGGSEMTATERAFAACGKLTLMSRGTLHKERCMSLDIVRHAQPAIPLQN
jgi:hypothetical protein